MKRQLALLLCASLLGTALVGCGGSDEGNTPQSTDADNTGSTQTSEPVQTVKILAEITGGRDPEEHELWVKEFSEKSGVPIEMDVVTGSEYKNKLAAVLASGGNDYDIVYMTDATYRKLASSGLFVPLTERIQSSSVFGNTEAFPADEWDLLRQPDGEVYSIFNTGTMGRVPELRADWIEKLGLNPNPQSLDDYYTIFKAFTEQDPDGNGQNDTYGLTMNGGYDIQPWMSAYHLTDGFQQDADGKWYVPYATEAAIPVYEWLKKLYDEGILDPNFTTNGASACREMMMTDRAGCMIYGTNWVDFFVEKVKAEKPDSTFRIVAGTPALDAQGNGILNATASSLWLILNSSDNVDNAFKVLEFMNTQDGMCLSATGIENYDYTVSSDGKIVYTEIGAQHAGDHGSNFPKSLLYDNPYPPSAQKEHALDLIAQYGNYAQYREYGEDLPTMVGKYMSRVILGECTAEQAVSDFQAELKAKGWVD